MYKSEKRNIRFPWQKSLIVVSMFFGLIVLPCMTTSDLMAQGNLLITPRRVVFEGAKKNEELNLANTGSDTATFNVSMVQYRMKEDGAFEEIKEPDPGQFFADKNIRFFPRTVTLAPNEAQVVKMQLFRTTELAPGEYRSHIYFRAVPKTTALGAEEVAKDTTTLSVKLVPIFGITIPVIIRVGDNTTKVTLSDLKFETVNDTINRLTLAFNRVGNMSVYGDIDVDYIPPTGRGQQVGTLRGVAVYTPNPMRRIKMDLLKPEGVNYSVGKLQVTYSAQAEEKKGKFAEAELILR
jgi:P pilus assembly chaperone PapD